MAKVLSTIINGIKTTANNKPPKGKPNIGPSSTTGSRSGVIKPKGAKTQTLYNYGPSTMTNKKGGNTLKNDVSARRLGAGLVPAKGAMPKFGGK